MQTQVRYYDGISNLAHDAILSYHDEQHVKITYQQQTKIYSIKSFEYIASVGDILPCIDLPNDARIEFLTHEIPDWLNLKHKNMLNQVSLIERQWKWIAVSFVSVIVVIFATFKWLIPAFAYTVAMNLPADTLQRLGDESEKMVLQYTKDTQLSTQRQQQILQLYQRLEQKQPAKLIFRGGGRIGANALAIPNNTIVLTDELVELTHNDQELLGVLAHEQGHLDDRHSLQEIMRGLGISLFYMMITGDSSDLIANFPIAMISAKYSQKFELEADQNAIDELKRLGISPQHMANFLQRLEQQHGEQTSNNRLMDIFASHPPTPERVAQIQQQLP